MFFQSAGLPAAEDFDAVGWSNVAESGAGTGPKSAASHPGSDLHFVAGLPVLSWRSVQGKRDALLASDNLTGFAPSGAITTGSGAGMTFQLPPPDEREFFRLQISDQDTDGDGVNDC